jgi:hypothetical protein
MTISDAHSNVPSAGWRDHPILGGFRGASWSAVGLIFAINTGVAAILSIDNMREFWHPFVTAYSFGFPIAYAVNAMQPWSKLHPVRSLAAAVGIGTLAGFGFLIGIKGYILGTEGYTFPELLRGWKGFGWTAMIAFGNGLFVSLFYLLKFREARTRAEMLRAEADRNLLSRQAIEAELKLMQAQVEPHFLFNTLASVQFLTETDPPKANMMLGHLLAYLRAALPQLRSNSSTLGQETDLAQAYLSIMQMRMGSRLDFIIDVPGELRRHSFPPMLLMSLVENAIKHGLEPQAAGGTVRIEAAYRDGNLRVAVSDDGRGLADKIGNGVGLTNLRGRLRALYADRARFMLEELPPHGARATVEIPHDAG